MNRRYALAEARYILSHVYCVSCLPDDDGWIYEWRPGIAEAECCRCPCRTGADLRLYVASVRKATEWMVKENAAIDAVDRMQAAVSPTAEPAITPVTSTTSQESTLA